MRVFIAITKSNLGGAQRYVYDLATFLAKEHEVTVVCGGEGELVKKLEAEKIKVTSLPHLGRDVSLTNDYKTFFDLYHLLKHEKPDVLHLNSSKMGLLGALAGRLAGVKKIIFTAHGFEFNAPRPGYQKIFFKILYWKLFLFVDKIICVSERVASDIKHWPLVKSKLVVIHNGIEPFTLISRNAAREQLVAQLRHEILLIGTLAELHKVKGLDVALEAFAKEFSGKPVEFVILGSGDEEKSLKTLAEKLKIEKQVHFRGFVPNAREFLSGLDIFSFSSRSEGLPYALLEAGLASLPVVATRVGGIPEVIEDDQSGLLVPRDNPDSLAKAYRTLADSPEKRKTLGENLKKTVTNQFAKDSLLRHTSDLYA
jgi:glycosyltransferase involved in cell wall biosynthesis